MGFYQTMKFILIRPVTEGETVAGQTIQNPDHHLWWAKMEGRVEQIAVCLDGLPCKDCSPGSIVELPDSAIDK